MTDMTDTQGPVQSNSNKDKYIKTKLGELGSRLPIGVEVNKKLIKDIASRPWRFKEEKELGAYRDENKGLTLGAFISHMMSMMMTKIGPHNFSEPITKATAPERSLIVNQLYLGDVLYMYGYLRKVCLGKDVHSVIPCPFCELKNERILNLDELDVFVVDDPSRLIQEVELYDGVKIFGELRKKLKVRPPTWMIMQNQDMFGDNLALRTGLLINECVVGAEGIEGNNPIVIIENDMDEMSKMDIELLSATIEDTPGPKMAVELDCARCRQQSLQIIDWRYDAFFSSVSQSRRGNS